jgi:hypothetical protein
MPMNVASSLADQMTFNIGAGMMSSMGGSGIAIQAVNMFTKTRAKAKTSLQIGLHRLAATSSPPMPKIPPMIRLNR